MRAIKAVETYQLNKIFPQDERESYDRFRCRVIEQQLVVDLHSDGAKMSEPVLHRLAFSIVVVVLNFGKATSRNDQRFVKRIQEAAEILQTFLDRQDDAVQHYSIVLKEISV